MNPIIEEEVRKRVEQLQRVIEKGLNSDKKKRFKNVSEIIAAVREL